MAVQPFRASPERPSGGFAWASLALATAVLATMAALLVGRAADPLAAALAGALVLVVGGCQKSFVECAESS